MIDTKHQNNQKIDNIVGSVSIKTELASVNQGESLGLVKLVDNALLVTLVSCQFPKC